MTIHLNSRIECWATLMTYLSLVHHLNLNMACQVWIATVWENISVSSSWLARLAKIPVITSVHTLYAVDLDPEAQYTLKKRTGNFRVEIRFVTVGSQHRNLSVICLLQNFYFTGTQTMRRNSHYVVLCNMPADKRKISSIRTQMFPEIPEHIFRVLEEAIKMHYGCLLVDLKHDTQSSEHLKSQVFQDERVDMSENKKSPLHQ